MNQSFGAYSSDETEIQIGTGYVCQLEDEPAYRREDLDFEGFEVFEKCLYLDEPIEITGYYHLPPNADVDDINSFGPVGFDISTT